jgi:hypothetical protein
MVVVHVKRGEDAFLFETHSAESNDSLIEQLVRG